MPEPPDPSATSDTVSSEGEAFLSAAQRLAFSELAAPEAGKAVRIAQSVRWCRIPLPIELNHINTWLLDQDDGCTIVDTGLASQAGEDAWRALAASELEHTPVRSLFITHIHPDHLGLASWLQAAHAVPVAMSARTHEQLLQFMQADPEHTADAERFLTQHGATGPMLKRVINPRRFARMISGLPEVSRHVTDGELLQLGRHSWRALETNGHAEGHLCLFNERERVLISGDQVLPTISPNIGLTWRNRDPNPLASFLASLDRLYALPEDTLVLPSHGQPFRGLHARIDDLRRHHHAQLTALCDACSSGKTALEILSVMFRRPLQGMHFLLGMAEAVAHLEYLVSEARLVRDERGEIVRYVTA